MRVRGDALAHDVRRHRLRQLLPHREGEAHDPARVLEGLFGLDRAVGDDLRDPLAAVLLGDIADHLTAPALVEVDVEVGHRHALGVEEALEDQAVRDRVEVGDLHRVGAHRARTRAAARADADALGLGPRDEVGDDEEVAGVALVEDDLGLVVGLLARVVGDAGREALVQAGLDLLDEPAALVLPRRAREARHEAPLSLGEAHLAALGDRQRVVARLGQLTPQVAHLFGGLEVEVLGVELEPVRVHERRAGLDAQERRVRRRVGRLRVVQVVRRDERQVQPPGQAQEVLLDPPLDVEPVVHELAVVVLGAEDVAVVARGLDRLVPLPEPQPGLHLTRGAAGRRDEPGAVGLQQLAVHARLEVIPLEAGQRAEPEEVVHADVVLGEQRHVRVGTRARDVVAPTRPELHPRLVAAVRARREVALDADDRLDAVLRRLLPEIVGPEDEPVVRRGDRRHLHPRRFAGEVVDARRPVEHRVLGVAVQVDEGGGRHALLSGSKG